jgi:hypothetical protein
MAKMYQCDVCKNVYPGPAPLKLKLGKYDPYNQVFLAGNLDCDVCPDCFSSIKCFIDCKDPNHKSPFERDQCIG